MGLSLHVLKLSPLRKIIIDIETLSLAQKEKESARSAYMEALRIYWQSYFEIRKITLFDFETNQPLSAPYDSLVK